MSRRHLLVTNDFPPKIGGIQNYLWELWRRLPTDTAAVYTTPHRGAAEFDAEQSFPIERSPEPFLLPYPWLPRRIEGLATRRGSDLVVLDPAIPLGALAPRLRLPTAVILHGAEVTIPGRAVGLRTVMARTLDTASLVIAAGGYPLAEAERCVGHDLPSVVVPPGVDTDRFAPADPGRRAAIRHRYGLAEHDLLLATVNRLVPRKGMSRLIEAAALVDARRRVQASRSHGPQPRLRVIIAGTGREMRRLQRLAARLDAPVQLVGRLADDDVADLYAAADLMAMPCNSRWFGWEQEGFGIAFLEAAACAVPQIAGRSGGAHEAVENGVTGMVLDNPDDIAELAEAIEHLMDQPRPAGQAAG
jgi:phosphatidylinositol alpha-1,6-mannosyltransferase